MLGHTIDYRSTGGASFIFNSRINYNTTSPFYYIQVESVDGHFGSDLSYESHPIPNAPGEKSGDVFRRGKTLTFSGKIYGRALSEVYQGAHFLQHMLAETALRKLVFTPWDHGIQLYYNCRPYQDLAVTEQFDAEQKFVLAYVFGLRADDPFSYKLSDNSLFPTWQA